MGYVDLDSVYRSTTGTIVPAAWMDQVNDNIAFLGSANGAVVNTSETTTSATYADLTTVGPQVSLTTGAKAIVFARAYLTNTTAATDTFVGVSVSGATTIAALDIIRYGVPVANVPV